MKPTSRLIKLILASLPLAALPTLLGRELWVLYLAGGSALFFALVLDLAWLLRHRPALEAILPTAVGVGEKVMVPLSLRGVDGAAVSICGEAVSPLEAGPDLEVDPVGQDPLHLEMAAPRRGVGRLAALWIRVRGPLGLLFRIHRIPLEDRTIEVIPSLPRLRRLAISHFGDWLPRGGRHQTRMRGVGSEFDALEAYVPGMDPRHFDWNASARHQCLLVRRHRVEQNQRIVISLDTGRLMADPIGDLERLDHAINAALLLSFFALRGGDQVGLHAYAARPTCRVAPVAGIRRMQTLVRACSGLRAEPEETNHALGIRDLLTNLSRRTLVVVLTEFTDPTTAELMVDYLGQLARQHLVVFCSLEDPLLSRPMAARPDTPKRMAEAVAADHLRVDRAAVLLRLRRKGIHLVSSPPGEAAANLVMKYTEIKRRELIG